MAGTREHWQTVSAGQEQDADKNEENVQAAAPSALGYRTVSVLRSIFETNLTKKPKADSLLDTRKIRQLAAKLDSKNMEMTAIMSSSNNQYDSEHKLQSIMEEIMRLRQQSQEQIKRLTEEINRLEKQTKLQQEQILHLMDENEKVKQQLSLEKITKSQSIPDNIDGGKFFYSNSSVNSDGNTDLFVTFQRVADLRAKFESGTVSKQNEDISKMGESQQLNYLASELDKKTEMSSYITKYIESINRKEDIKNNTNALQDKSPYSVTNLRELFESGAVNRQKSKSNSDISQVSNNYNHVEKTYEVEHEKIIQETPFNGNNTQTEDEEITSFMNIAELTAMFETGSVSRNKTNSFSMNNSGSEQLQNLDLQFHERKLAASMNSLHSIDTVDEASSYSVGYTSRLHRLLSQY